MVVLEIRAGETTTFAEILYMIGADIHFQVLRSVTVPETSKSSKDSLQKDISTFIGWNSGPEIYSIRRRALFRRGSRKKILRVKFWKLINACLKVGIAFDAIHFLFVRNG